MAIVDVVRAWYYNIIVVLPNLIAAIIVLLIGWVVGRLLGKLVHMIVDKIAGNNLAKNSTFIAALEQSGVTIGYIFDIVVRLFVYLIAILIAGDILNLPYLSQLMMQIVSYIPHIAAFAIILIVGFILTDYFVDFLGKIYATGHIDLINPVLFLLRIFLYFVIAILALSQLLIDLTIIYTFITPIAWGIGLGLGAAIAIIFGFGLKSRSEKMVDDFFAAIKKK